MRKQSEVLRLPYSEKDLKTSLKRLWRSTTIAEFTKLDKSEKWALRTTAL